MSVLSGLRVVFVIDGFELGGSERQALLLARELVARGARVEVWGFFEPHRGRASELCESYGLPWRAIRLRWDRGVWPACRSLVRLIWLFRRARVQVILPYTICPNVICGAIWKLTGAVLCIWNQRDQGLYRMAPRLERWAVKQTPCFVSNSERGAAFLITELGVESGRIRMVSNGVQLDPPVFDRQTWRRRLELRADTFVVLMVGNLHRHKDHVTLLRAWRLVLDRTTSERKPVLLLAGRRDDTATAVEAFAQELGLGVSVRILGQVTDVNGLLQASDLFVFSSLSEGLPNAVLEAMAAGLPVVATDIPGIRDVVGEEGRRLLAAPGNYELIADLILDMANDPIRRSAEAARNRQRVVSCYSVEGMVTPMVDMIASAVSPVSRHVR